MSKRHKGYKILLAVFLCALVLLNGCQAVPSAKAIQEKENILAFLNNAKSDFEPVRQMVNDKDLSLDDESSGSDNKTYEAQKEEITALQKKISNYQTSVQSSLDGAQKRETLGRSELADFKQSELNCLKLSSDLLAEYLEIAGYMEVLFDVVNGVSSLSTFDKAQAQASFQKYTDTVEKAIDTLGTAKPPSFLQSLHTGFIGTFTQLKQSIEYIGTAASLNDPVRMDAGLYRFGVLNREFSKLITDTDADVARRKAKLKEDIAQINKLDSGLTAWLDDNISLLSGKGGASK